MTNEDVIKEEISSILEDIVSLYESSGRKVSGQFEEGLEAVYEFSAFKVKGTVRGYTYLAGRGKTKKGHKSGEKYLIDNIRQWIWNKGIAQSALSKAGKLTAKGKQNLIRGIAYAITKKIHEEGTKPSAWLKVYEQVITPARINQIIDRISELNVNKLINQVRAELEVLAKNV